MYGRSRKPNDQGTVEAFNFTITRLLRSSKKNALEPAKWTLERALKLCIRDYNEVRTHTSTKFIPLELFKLATPAKLALAEFNCFKSWKCAADYLPIHAIVILKPGAYQLDTTAKE